MKKQIVNVSMFQTAKVFGVLYLVVSLPFLVLFGLFMIFSGQFLAGLGMMVLTPLFYAVGGFLGTLLAAFVYNLVAARIGGIEYTTADL